MFWYDLGFRAYGDWWCVFVAWEAEWHTVPTRVTTKVHNRSLATGNQLFRTEEVLNCFVAFMDFCLSIILFLQIVECRRVLKWTYAYGYYLPEHEHAKRQFFEYLQGNVSLILKHIFLVSSLSWSDYCTGDAESGLERLHQCAEKELQVYLNAEGPSKDFNEFRTKLAGLTR